MESGLRGGEFGEFGAPSFESRDDGPAFARKSIRAPLTSQVSRLFVFMHSGLQFVCERWPSGLQKSASADKLCCGRRRRRMRAD